MIIRLFKCGKSFKALGAYLLHDAGKAESQERLACPKAFRHAFGVGTLQASIPINLTQRWLGHARLSTTSIYADACGPEEIAFAARFWKPSAAPSAAHALQET